MDARLLARIAAAVFVGLAIATALLQLREEPAVLPAPASGAWVPDGDPLPARLRACAAMGELALSSRDCRAAWAEKRRRFFGVGHPVAYDIRDDPPSSPLANPSVPSHPADRRGED